MAKTYNATADSIKGDELFLYVADGANNDPIAHGTSCSVDLSADTIEVSSKMSGSWKEFLVGQIGFTVSCDSLISMTSGHLSFQRLKNLMAAKTPIPIVIGKATGTDFAKDEANTYVHGMAVITSLSMKADKGTSCTSSISLQGTGELVDGAIGDNSAALVVSPTSLAFTAAADSTGKIITVSSTANVTSAKAPAEFEWLTVTKSLKVVTVKVSANTNSESRTANVTIVADGLTTVVPVTQAGA